MAMKKHNLLLPFLISLLVHYLMICVPFPRVMQLGVLKAEEQKNITAYLLKKQEATQPLKNMKYAEEKAGGNEIKPVNQDAGIESKEAISEKKNAGSDSVGIKAGEPSQSEYYLTSDLDEKLEPVLPIIIPSPNDDVSEKEGSLILEIYIGNNGYVDNVEVFKSDVPYEYELSVVNRFKAANFIPGLVKGNPVPVKMKVEVKFFQDY